MSQQSIIYLIYLLNPSTGTITHMSAGPDFKAYGAKEASVETSNIKNSFTQEHNNG